MSEQYDNNLSGALFINDRRRDGKKDPHMQGQCEIDGRKFWISAWTNTDKSGKRYQSLKFRLQDQPAPAQQKLEPEKYDDMDDPIPF